MSERSSVLHQHDLQHINSDALLNDLRLHGFAFVNLPPALRTLANDAALALQSFFAESEAYKQRFAARSPLGYSSAASFRHDDKVFKEKLSYVVLPGDCDPLCEGRRDEELASVLQLKPGKFAVASLKPLMKTLLEECRRICDELFPNAANVIGDNVPFVGHDVSKQFALFDVAYYHNAANRAASPPLNCSSHFDPGLFAFSVFSSSEGLQLQLSNGTFVDAPLDCGVIWCGAAAKAFNCKPAIHRVVNGAKPRLTFWAEIAANVQQESVLGTVNHMQMSVTNVFPEMDQDVSNGEVEEESKSDQPKSKWSSFLSWFSSRSVPEAATGIPNLEQKYGLALTKPLYVPENPNSNPMVADSNLQYVVVMPNNGAETWKRKRFFGCF